MTVVQASRMEQSGHFGFGFRHVFALLMTWIFWTVSDSRIPPAILKTISARSYQLQPYCLKVSPCNYATISNPKQSLLNKHPYFLSVPVLILDNSLCNFVLFAFISPFCSPVDYKYFLNLCLLGYSPQFGSNKTLFYSYYRLVIDYFCWQPEANIMLYINNTSIFLKKSIHTQRKLNYY